MAANFCSKLSGRGITLWILCLAAVFAFAANVSAQKTFSSGSDGSDGAFDLTGTAPGTIVNFDPSQIHGARVANNIFNFTTINIPTGVTVRLSGRVINVPVWWLAQGNVTINGTIDLSGEDGQPAAAILANRIRAMPGAGGFAGGVGGKFDPTALSTSPVAQPGDGPAGGAAGDTNPNRCDIANGVGVYNGVGGGFTANPFLVPLVGGSGGGGNNFLTRPGGLAETFYGPGGGAGGGALLVASSTSLTVSGTIKADGGAPGFVPGAFCGSSPTFLGGGGGAGGAIRLMAPAISGTGTLTALGGCNFFNISPCGTNGAIRLEAFTDNFTGSFKGTPESMGSPFNTFLPAVGPPSVTVTSVNGVNVTQPPTGSLATPDATIDTGSAVQITIQARFIPPGTVLTLKVFSDNDTDQIVQTTPLLGTLQSSTATATVTFPSGFSLNYVKATWTQ